MHDSNKLHTFAAALLLVPLGLPAALSFHPEEDTVLSKEFTIEAAFELDDMSVLVNGQDMSDGVDLGDFDMQASVTALLSDEYVSVEDGRPLELLRRFDEVSMEYDTNGEQGSENAEDIEGVAVVFKWNDDTEGYDVDFAEDSESADESVLEGLMEDMDFRGLLPAGDAEQGDSWDVESDTIVGLMFPGMQLSHILSMAQDSGDGIPEGILEQLEDLHEGLEMTCEYTGVRDVDGVSAGVIQITMEGSSALDLSAVLGDAMELPEGADSNIEEATLGVSLEGEGELLWNVEAGHMLSFELESELELELNAVAAVEVQGNSLDVEGSIALLGEISWSAALTE